MFHKPVYPVEFARYVDILRAMMRTLAATDAMVCLTEAWHAAVVSHKECSPSLTIVFCLAVFWHIAFINTFVVMQQYRRYVYTIGTWHAILTVVTGNGRILHHQVCRVVKELSFLIRKRL